MDITSIDVETQIIDGSNVDEEGWWGDYDIDDAKNGIEWSLTEEVWNSAPLLNFRGKLFAGTCIYRCAIGCPPGLVGWKGPIARHL